MVQRYYLQVMKTQKKQRTYKSQGKTHAFFKCYIFFHVFTSENMGDRSVLAYSETPKKP